MTDSNEAALRAYLPASFGKGERQTDQVGNLENARRETAVYPKSSTNSLQNKAEDDDEDDEQDEDEEEFPVSHEMVVKTHEKAVTSVTLDPSGSRLISGSMDCTMKLHDFAAMTPTTVRAFKSIDPTATKQSAQLEAHPIHRVLYNPISPSQVLVVSATPQAKIFSREGEPWTTFVKGDMYLRDMHNTKGHVSEVTSGVWHPTNQEVCVTSGSDSTLRIWDVNNSRSQRDVIVHKSKAVGAGGRSRMTAVAWGSPAQGGLNVLISAAQDGCLTMWAGDGPYNRPTAEIRDAHTPETWTGGLDISRDGRLVVTRGGDDLIKIWDLRKFKTPVNSVAHTSTSAQYPTTGICFSPDSSTILTGSSDGSLYILNPATLRSEHIVKDLTPGSPIITVLWHEKLNQIITGSANAETRVLFSPAISTSGAKMVMSRASKRRHIDDDPNLTMDLSQGVVADSSGNLTAAAGSFASRHPNTGMTASGKSRDPRRPHIPTQTPFAKSQPDEEYVRNNIKFSGMREEDPREALLKYADKAKNDPMFTNAWKATQPNTIYAELSEEEDEDDEREKKRAKH